MKKILLSLLLLVFCLFGTKAQNEPKTATFEDLELSADSYWTGSDSLGLKNFQSGGFLFANSYDTAYGGYWGGFGYANLTETEYAEGDSYNRNSFKNVVGGGAEGSRNYALAYASAYNPAVVRTADTEGTVIKGAFFTLNATALNTLLNGDDFGAAPFQKGDFAKIRCVGYMDKDSVGATDIYLADYRSEKAEEHYYLNAWTWFDLSVLGKVNRVEFSVVSSQQNQWGEVFPQYFCMDNLNDARPLTANRNLADAPQMRLYPVPARETLNIATGEQNYRIDILSLSGKCLKSASHLDGQTAIGVSDLPAGAYLLRLITARGKIQTLRFIVG